MERPAKAMKPDAVVKDELAEPVDQEGIELAAEEMIETRDLMKNRQWKTYGFRRCYLSS